MPRVDHLRSLEVSKLLRSRRQVWATIASVEDVGQPSMRLGAIVRDSEPFALLPFRTITLFEDAQLGHPATAQNAPYPTILVLVRAVECTVVIEAKGRPVALPHIADLVSEGVHKSIDAGRPTHTSMTPHTLQAWPAWRTLQKSHRPDRHVGHQGTTRTR